MIFSKLIGLRYCLYFFATTTVLASIYTFLDLLEKITRYHNASISTVSHYIGIVFIPNFIALSPIGCLLGSILLLREWTIYDQFVTMAIHGISKVQFSGIIFTYSLITAGSIFFLHETIGHLNAQKIHQIKSHVFKQTTQNSLWARINTTSFIMDSKQKAYIIETNNNPNVTVISFQSEAGRNQGTKFDFQKETLTPHLSSKTDKKYIHPLTYSSVEESFIKTIRQKATLHNQRIMSDLLIFFLKLLFLPFFITICFQIAIQRIFIRWIYAAIPYVALGIGSGCMQLLSPLAGFIVFSSLTLSLAIFLLKK